MNGLIVSKAVFNDHSVMIDVESFLSDKFLKILWTKKYATDIMIDGRPEYIIINKTKVKVTGTSINLNVLPGKYISVSEPKN
jgi:hypothetical protein